MKSRCLPLSALLCLFTASAAFGQAAGPTWVAFDTQPAGTPPSVVVDRLGSTEDQTALNITIHGFYFTPITIPGVGNFRRLSLGLNDIEGVTMTPGRPELPILPLTLAIPTNAAGLATPAITIQNFNTLAGYDVYPAQSDYIEEEGVPPTPPPPAHDAIFYGMNTTYPSAASEVIGTPELMHGVKTQGVHLHPFRVNPAMHTLTINRQMNVIIPHNGAALPSVEVTRRTSRMLAKVIDNWTAVSFGYVLPNTTEYKGEYLILTPSQWINSVDVLADQKSERGYRVTVRTTEFTGNTDQQIYNAIDSWYNARPSGADCYVLLIGDTDKIPLGYSPRHAANVSDYAYSCHPLGTNSQQDLYLGRLSVSSTTELDRIINRIITYQDNPASSARYDNVLLAAHRQTENGYVACVNQIFDALYPGSSSQFIRRRGSLSDGTVANVIDDMADGQGVVIYRGHGGGRSWSGWDFNHTSLTVEDVNAMAINFVRPVIFSVACSNSQIDRSGEICISEAWHRRLNGAVAHVGGSRSTWTNANHTYAKSIALVTYALVTSPSISFVMDVAGIIMASNGGDCGWDNRYLYLLQGDPEMVIWRENPASTGGFSGALRGGALPEWLPPGLATINLTFQTTAGDPVVGAIVAAYKTGEVQENRYTDMNGGVSFIVNPSTCGELTIRAYTDDAAVRGQRLVIPIAILGDADRDGVVDFADITKVLENWARTYTSVLGPGDADFSLNVNFADITAVLRDWGSSCN